MAKSREAPLHQIWSIDFYIQAIAAHEGVGEKMTSQN